MLYREAHVDKFLSHYGEFVTYALNFHDLLRLPDDTEGRLYELSKQLKVLGKELLGGEIVKLKKPMKVGSKTYTYILHENDRLVPLPYLSSGKQELIPIVLAVQLASSLLSWTDSLLRDQLLVIEEPESHVSPAVQLDMMNMILSPFEYVFEEEYKSHGLSALRYVITTHSPYVISAINLKLKQWDVLGLLKDRQKTMVSAYEIKDGKALLTIDDEGLIDAKSFDEVANEVAEKLWQLYRDQES